MNRRPKNPSDRTGLYFAYRRDVAASRASLPERLHISALVAAFTPDLLFLMINWSEFGRSSAHSRRFDDGRGPTPAMSVWFLVPLGWQE